MSRRRPAFGPPDEVKRTVDLEQTAIVGSPDPADDRDCLFERADALARGEAPAPHRFDGLPERSGTEPELDPAPAEQVETRDAPCEHSRLPQGKVGHIGRQVDRGRLGGGVRDQRPGVEETGLIGMVLEGGEVEPGGFAGLDQRNDRVWLRVRRCDEGAELEFVTVIGHRLTISRGRGSSVGVLVRAATW